MMLTKVRALLKGASVVRRFRWSSLAAFPPSRSRPILLNPVRLQAFSTNHLDLEEAIRGVKTRLKKNDTQLEITRGEIRRVEKLIEAATGEKELKLLEEKIALLGVENALLGVEKELVKKLAVLEKLNFEGNSGALQQNTKAEIDEAHNVAINLKAAKAFITSVMQNTIQDIPNGDGMRSLVVASIPSHNVNPVTVFIRKHVQSYFKVCMERAQMGHPVSAVGSQGTGKSTSTPYLVRLLLEDKARTVVYLVRTPEKSGWFYEFSSSDSGSIISTNVYPERINAEGITSLGDPNNAYVVDPNGTQTTCIPERSQVRAQIYVVPSPNADQVGGTNFGKDRGDFLGGVEVVNTRWTLEECLIAIPLMGSKLQPDQIIDLYRIHGGNLRFILQADQAAVKLQQTIGIDLLQKRHLSSIVRGELLILNSADDRQPKGAVMQYESIHPFGMSDTQCVVASKLLEDRIFVMHEDYIWNSVISSDAPNARNIFEVLLRNRLLKSRIYECAPVRETSDQNTEQVEFGGCSSMRMVKDPCKVIQEAGEFEMFHSTNPTHALFDYIYYKRKSEGAATGGREYVAVNGTLGLIHDCSVHKIHAKVLELNLQRGDSVHVLFGVSSHFKEFKTTPVDPVSRYNAYREDQGLWPIDLKVSKIRIVRLKDEHDPVQD
jgi:hypothetical protein